MIDRGKHKVYFKGDLVGVVADVQLEHVFWSGIISLTGKGEELIPAFERIDDTREAKDPILRDVLVPENWIITDANGEQIPIKVPYMYVERRGIVWVRR